MLIISIFFRQIVYNTFSCLTLLLFYSYCLSVLIIYHAIFFALYPFLRVLTCRRASGVPEFDIMFALSFFHSSLSSPRGLFL